MARLLFVMHEDIKRFRANALECKVLSVRMPEQRDALLEIADAWVALADKLEKRLKPAGQDDKEPEPC
jgi:hypothetical protein